MTLCTKETPVACSGRSHSDLVHGPGACFLKEQALFLNQCEQRVCRLQMQVSYACEHVMVLKGIPQNSCVANLISIAAVLRGGALKDD